MSKLPLHLLSLSPSGKLLAVACVNVFHVIDVSSGKLLCTSPEEPGHRLGCMIRHIVWRGEAALITSGEDKLVKQWHLDTAADSGIVTCTMLGDRELSKRANVIAVTRDGQSMVVADKFGDVYAYPMHGCAPSLPKPPGPVASASADPEEVRAANQRSNPPMKRIAGVAKGNQKQPQWPHIPARLSEQPPILGHVSMITSMLVLDDVGKIITADRDEHIRVSEWPNSWKISRFLLGHKQFVSYICTLPSHPHILLSAGGEDHIRLWDLQSESTSPMRQIDVSALKGHAEIQIEIPRTSLGKQKRKKWNRKNQRKQAAKKAKRAAHGDDSVADAPKLDAADGEQPPAESDSEEQDAKPPATTRTKQLELAVRKVVFMGKRELEIAVFSSVGSSVLLVMGVPSLLGLTTDVSPSILDLEYPILDIAGSPSSKLLWVSLDLQHGQKPAPSGDTALRCFEQHDSGLLFPCTPTALHIAAQCARSTTDGEPYPQASILYPEIGLLSKDPYQNPFGQNEDGDGPAGAEDEAAEGT